MGRQHVIAFFLVYFLLALNCFNPCYPQNYWQNNGLPNNDLNAITFINPATGWSAGSEGVILNTTDGGIHWNFQESGTSKHLYSIQFIESGKGWAGGDSGIILYSNDHGNHWFTQVTPTLSCINALFVFNEYQVWAVLENGGIIHTANGGELWQSQYSGSEYPLNAIFFIDFQYHSYLLFVCQFGNLWYFSHFG